MNIGMVKNYLNRKITNWYRNAEIDYNISGKFIDAKEEGNNLRIIWEEMGERLEMTINWFREYHLEHLYNIWMEG